VADYADLRQTQIQREAVRKDYEDQNSTANKKRHKKTDGKIPLPGRAVRNTESEDRVSGLCVVK
jgi:hypothetical protein